MVTECPICHTEYANRYIQAHITRLSKTDEAHRKYRDSQKQNEVHQEPIIIDPLDKLELELQKNWGTIKIVTGERGKGMSALELQTEPVYKETTSQIPESASKPPARMRKLTNPEPPRKMQVRKLKTTVIKPKKIGLLAFKVL